jgi:hypothetical protein
LLLKIKGQLPKSHRLLFYENKIITKKMAAAQNKRATAEKPSVVILGK